MRAVAESTRLRGPSVRLFVLLLALAVVATLPPDPALAWCPDGDACYGQSGCEGFVYPNPYWDCWCQQADNCGRCCFGICCVYSPVYQCWYAQWHWCGCDCD